MGQRAFIADKVIDVAAIKLEEMQQVADIIEIAQRAGRRELMSIKAGLDATFGDDWRDFKPQRAVPCEQQTSADVGKCENPPWH